MTHKLKIFFSSNAFFAPSGYGVQMFHLLPYLLKEGYPLAHEAFYGLEGAIISLNGITVYPKIASAWGEDGMVMHTRDFKADITLSLQDIWTLDPNALRQLTRWIPYLPIDHDPPPPPVLDRLQFAYRIVTFAKFAQDRLRKLGFYTTYIPHMIDTDVLKPMDKPKEELKKAIGIPPDYFIFGMVSANKDNPSRKSLQEVMDAFSEFHKKYPKSGMYFHSILNQPNGFPIDQYAKVLGLEAFVYHVEPYKMLYKIDRHGLAAIYNAFDCLVAPSSGEGFGVPIAEAQSCGVPVITNNFTAMPEHIIEGKTGYLTKINYKRFTPLGSFQAYPDVTSIYNCMIDMYNADRKTMGKLARENCVNLYDKDMVWTKYWKPYFEKLESEIYPPELTPPPKPIP